MQLQVTVMNDEKTQGIGFFQKYLTVWVALCMIAGVLIGKFLPGFPTFLNQFEYAKVSIPVAILIWVMIYPMMMKVDFQSVKNVSKNPKGLDALLFHAVCRGAKTRTVGS